MKIPFHDGKESIETGATMRITIYSNEK